MTATTTALATLAVAAATAAGCGNGGNRDEPRRSALPQGAETVRLDPADFTTRIENRYWPMRPGARWVYRETEPSGEQKRVVVVVTGRTRRVANGITARVVHDRVTSDGRLVEDTLDWYAQDGAGNIWYLGEDTTEYENGKPVGKEGSWEAGVDGAQPGVALPARPEVGMSYRQEHYAGHAEDRGEVIATGEQAQVPFGHFARTVMTRDTTPLEPRVVEHKFYAPGVGPVLTLDVSGAGGREELVSHELPAP